MIDPHDILPGLATVLGVAAVTTVLCQKLHQPVVLGYLLAGFIVGPNLAVPLVANRELVATLAEIGVILLMFSLGLEFSLKKLTSVGLRAVITGIIETSIMLALGYNLGLLWGWEPKASFVLGAVVAISSTTVIAKTFEEQAVSGALRESVIGVLVVEDLIAIGLLTVITTTAGGAEVSWLTLMQSGGRLLAFLVILLVIGLLMVPRLIRAIVALKREETLLVASVGLCFGVATVAHIFGYSVALGAFIAGSLVAESGEGKLIEKRIRPVRDMFAAIFFVSVGMLIDPSMLMERWPWVLTILVVVLFGKTIGVTIGALLSGQRLRSAAQMGFTLAQVGEFSLIIAGLGVTMGTIPPWLTPVVVAVVAITTLTTPWLIRGAEPAAKWMDRKLPQPLQNVVTLYATWVHHLSHRHADVPAERVQRLARLLLLDALALTVLVVVAAHALPTLAHLTAELSQVADLGLSLHTIGWILTGFAIVLALPFAIGLLRITRGLGVELARRALPLGQEGQTDLADAPRRAMVVILQLTVLLVVCLPLLALLQPFVPAGSTFLILVALMVGLGPALWRSTMNLQGHIRAGSELIAEVLLSHAQQPTPERSSTTLAPLQTLLPGLGEPTIVQIPESSPARGQTLGALQLRGRTGASVMALVRDQQAKVAPGASEMVYAGDLIALVGTSEATQAARELLEGHFTPPTTTRVDDSNDA